MRQLLSFSQVQYSCVLEADVRSKSWSTRKTERHPGLSFVLEKKPSSRRLLIARSAESATSSSGLSRFSGSIGDIPYTIREASANEYWDVAEIHCESFYPMSYPPGVYFLRLDRVLALHLGALIQENRKARNGRYCCLVAASDSSSSVEYVPELLRLFSQGFDSFGDHWNSTERVRAAIVVDTLAQYIPKRLVGRSSWATKAYISNLAVSTSCRRQGVGEALLAEAESICREWGCDEIFLHCDPENRAAYALYLKAGYAPVQPQEGDRGMQPLRDAELVLMAKPSRGPRQQPGGGCGGGGPGPRG
uniref:Acyl-n-acyltransferase n=1 Tax=Tetraselmis sp. GSL018 TaxID=582737 RepID=A0A061R7J1_9CHLO